MSIVSRMGEPMHVVDDSEIKGKDVTVPGTEPPKLTEEQKRPIPETYPAVTPLKPVEKPETQEPQEPQKKNLAQTVLNSLAESQKTDNSESEPQMYSYDDVIKYLQDRMAAIHIPTKEELEKERRRQRTERIISSASDAGRALANLFATSEYAPNAYEGNVMTERMQQRFDRLKAEREADADRYYNYAMTLGRIKDAKEQQAYQRGRDKVADAYRAAAEKRAQEQADFERSLDPYKLQEQIGDTAKAGYEAEEKRIEALYAPLIQEAELALKNAKTETERKNWTKILAEAQNAYASAAQHNRTNLLEYEAEDEYGNVRNFSDENAAVQYAKRHGTYEEPVKIQAQSSTNEYGQSKTSATANVSSGGYPKRTSKNMPGVSNKGNKGTMPGVK